MIENRTDAKAEIADLVRNLPGSLLQVYAGGENVSVSGISPLFLVLRFPQGETCSGTCGSGSSLSGFQGTQI
jgi:hypothetical protein